MKQSKKKIKKLFSLYVNIEAERDMVYTKGNFTLLGLAEVTDWEDQEFDQISDLQVGQTLSLDKGFLTVTRIS
jgi:hypothetical protein